MRGFILDLKRVRDEDLIVTLLLEDRVKSYYRFYGVRHSILQIGNLIDFEEIKSQNGQFLDRLKGVSQISFEWIYNRNRLLIWQNLTQIIFLHLKDSTLLDSFYFNLLLKMAKRWSRQNPKRLFCEAVLSILKFEGRVSLDMNCFVCQREIESEYLSLVKGFLVAHKSCIKAFEIRKEPLIEFLKSNKTVKFEDSEVEILYNISKISLDY